MKEETKFWVEFGLTMSCIMLGFLGLFEMDIWLQQISGEAPCLGNCEIINATQNHIFNNYMKNNNWWINLSITSILIVIISVLIYSIFKKSEDK